MNKRKDGELDIKIVLLGKAYAGKTCLVQRYVNQMFTDTPYQNTIGAAYASARVKVNGKTVILNIWDTAGSERYQSMSRIYYRGAKAAILCFDLTDAESFDKARYWSGELERNEPDCLIYLCGTKKDMVDIEPGSRATPIGQVQSLARDLRSELYETSSTTGEKVNEVFMKIATDFVDNLKNLPIEKPRTDSFKVSHPTDGQRRGWCSSC
ncbi:ras-related protein Rab-24-like [Mytilus trossulus]|uniref:ras-related protein Rab-24-like n=1 Tax=Mytilus trossulus TaxID=6551 RepID=UPI0030047D14